QMSYFGSFSNSAFPRDEPYDARRASAAAAEPYGSSRYSLTDSAWALNQTANIWPTQQPQQQQHRYEQPRYEQPRYEQPRYMQVFDQQPLSSSLSTRPMNPMPLSQSMFGSYGYTSGSSALSSTAFNTGRNDRYEQSIGGGRKDDRQWFPQDDRRGGGYSGGSNYRNDNRSGGGTRNYNNSRNGNGDNRRQNNERKRNDSDYAPRRVSEGASPKQNKQKKGDYVPSRIAPASKDEKRDERPRDGKKVFGKDGGGGGRRNNQNGKPMRRRANRSTDFEFKSIPSDVESKTFVVKGENLVCFNGLQSVLATQHEFPIVIDGNVYSSVDHYYQIEKCKQLADKDCEALVATVQKEEEYKGQKDKIKGGSNNYGQLAREFIKENKIERSTVEEWRREGGVFATYSAMRAKAQQCSEMRDLLISSVNKIIVHTYAGDAIFGSGTRVQFVHKWADELAKTGTKIQITLAPLVDTEAISMAPQIAQGRNLLGLIHMQLAEEISKGTLPFTVTAASLEAISTSNSTVDAIDNLDVSQEQEDELMNDD
ncbi:hypothetical protein PENTCL1PPCAC_7576, partial [Pristionchus entomophagus]